MDATRTVMSLLASCYTWVPSQANGVLWSWGWAGWTTSRLQDPFGQAPSQHDRSL